MKKELPIALTVITIGLVYVLGMIYWPYMPKTDPILSKLYYPTTASVMYAMSLIIHLIAQSRWLKVCSFAALGIFSVNLYVELFLDPANWSKWSLGLLIIVPTKMFLLAVIINKVKAKK